MRQRFGQKLRTLRTRRGLSYRQLAGMLDTSHSHLLRQKAAARFMAGSQRSDQQISFRRFTQRPDGNTNTFTRITP